MYVLDILWGQPIKLIQVASNSELHENQLKDLRFFEILPSICARTELADSMVTPGEPGGD